MYSLLLVREADYHESTKVPTSRKMPKKLPLRFEYIAGGPLFPAVGRCGPTHSDTRPRWLGGDGRV